MALRWKPPARILVAVDSSLDAVVRVDPLTGDRTIVSSTSNGTGPAFNNPLGIAVEATGDLVVVDADLDAVVRVDPVTGDRTIVSAAGTGYRPSNLHSGWHSGGRPLAI